MNGYGLYKCDLKALEDIPNNSLCTKTKEGIRRIDGQNTSGDLVYVNNISPINSHVDIIKLNEFCRYMDVIVIPKF